MLIVRPRRERMHLDDSTTPLDRVVFATARVAVGEWRCDRRRHDFHDTGPIERYLVAFPRTAVAIRHDGSRSFVCDPTLFTVYNRGQRYTREAIDPAGDRCDWWGVDGPTARAIAAAVDPRWDSDPQRPFRFQKGPADAALYLRQRTLLRRLRCGDLDEVEAEEEAIAIVAEALARAAGRDRLPPIETQAGHYDLAQRACRLLAVRYADKLTLDGVAGMLGVSAFHLCRIFRAQTGVPLHRHLTGVRLRVALEAVERADRDLSRVGLDVGFSSHSHFTAAFRREFGLTPSAWRRANVPAARAGASSPRTPARTRYLRRV